MNTYVLVSFWACTVVLVTRLLELALRKEWPHKREETLGLHLFKIFVAVAWFCWGGYLLWLGA